MAHLFYPIFLSFLLFSAFGHAKRDIPTHKISSPFNFKTLEGCHKGNHTEGIHHLKTYLKTYGYLECTNLTHFNDDDFDDALESALKTYQENYHIKPTGTLDHTTISTLNTPRCGVPDIVNGTNFMRSHKRNKSNTIHTVSHYSFFPRRPRWPSSKTHLTYRFVNNFPTGAIAPVQSAFQKWAAATYFTFSQVQMASKADLEIGFYSGDHGDGAAFGGESRAIAHAFSPTIGWFHYNSGVKWSVDQKPGEFHLESVAVHEIGRLLGLGNSQVKQAVMYASIPTGVIKTDLNPDDIAGIRDLYDV